MGTTLYPGIAFSPQAALADNIGAADTIIKVTDASVFPDAPNLATIGTDEEGETILYAAKTADALSGCTRGVEGTPKAWSAGEAIGRNFTAKDHNDLIAAILAARVDVDAAPTEGSENPVSSGGTFAALSTKQDALAGLPGQVVGFDAAGEPVPVRGWSNPQLLINWDFRRPVNRNGQTEYAGSGGYCVDRWLRASKDVTVSLVSGGVLISFSDGSMVRTPIENASTLSEKEVTLSVKASEVTGAIAIRPRLNGTPVFSSSATVSDGVAAVTITLPADVQSLDFEFAGAAGQKALIEAVKLELGGRQTLANKNDNGEWEIIDPPNYDLQYALCSLYSPSTGEWVGSQHSNSNLLDNAYWASKDAIINQRGQDKYAGIVYGIDRWFVGASLTLDLLSNSIKITSNGTSGISFIQRRELCLWMLGSLVTFSVLTADGELLSVTGTVPTVPPSTYECFIHGVPSINSGVYLQAYIWGTGTMHCSIVVPNGNSIEVIAAKLELGPVQTLARQDADGNWVLNDPPPNKALELAKCQRYQYINSSGSSEFIAAGHITSNAIYFDVPLPVPLRSNPTITPLIGISVVPYVGGDALPDFSFSSTLLGGTTLRIGANKTNHGLSTASLNLSKVLFDSNL